MKSRVVRLIKGNNSTSVTIGMDIYSDIAEKEKLTVDLYSLHNNSLMLFEYIKGKKVRVKLYNSLDVENEVKSISNIDNFQVHNI